MSQAASRRGDAPTNNSVKVLLKKWELRPRSDWAFAQALILLDGRIGPRAALQQIIGSWLGPGLWELRPRSDYS